MPRLLFAALLAMPLSVLAADPQTVVLDVQNMTCELCPITVKKALDTVPGVASTKIDLTKKTATAFIDGSIVGCGGIAGIGRGFHQRRLSLHSPQLSRR